MDLWQLRIFCKVIEERSFSKAARAIHLSQPTVSSHVRDIEAHFDCRLIDRLSQGAAATKARQDSILVHPETTLSLVVADTQQVINDIAEGSIVLSGAIPPTNPILS